MPVHQPQIYAMVLALVGLGACVWLRRRRNSGPDSFSGEVGLFGLAWFVFARMIVEDPFRFDGAPTVAGPITSGQISALVFVSCVVAFWAARRVAARKDPAAHRNWQGGPWTPKEEKA